MSPQTTVRLETMTARVPLLEGLLLSATGVCPRCRLQPTACSCRSPRAAPPRSDPAPAYDAIAARHASYGLIGTLGRLHAGTAWS